MPKPHHILLVDDNPAVLDSMQAVLEHHGYTVSIANSVNDALRLISNEMFDALISDLHMPGAGDGLTVVSAMRHANPLGPAMEEAKEAILLQADEILVKPMAVPDLLALMAGRLANVRERTLPINERVAGILERNTDITISDWLERVDREPELTAVRVNAEQRIGHLPKLLAELIDRLRVPRELGTKHISEAAVQHGRVRQSQGYTISMIIEESRILQVSIFATLRKNLDKVDFSLLLLDVMTIADECDSQLKQTVNSFSGIVAAKEAA
jgi:CheY-like chemotaxis protein